jgi:hypothetical protein
MPEHKGETAAGAPNLVCTGVKVVECFVDEDGVISEATPSGVPRFIEVGFKDGNVLKIYADGTHSDMDEFRFVEYQAPANYPARRWLFEQFLEEEHSVLLKVYLWCVSRGSVPVS